MSPLFPEVGGWGLHLTAALRILIHLVLAKDRQMALVNYGKSHPELEPIIQTLEFSEEAKILKWRNMIPGFRPSMLNQAQ